MTYESDRQGAEVDAAVDATDPIRLTAPANYILRRTGTDEFEYEWSPDTGGGGSGNLNSDGSVPMDPGYGPSVDQDIATKIYVDDKEGIFLSTTGPILFGLNNTEVARIEQGPQMGIGTDNPMTTLHIKDPFAAGGTISGIGNANMVIEGDDYGSLLMTSSLYHEIIFGTQTGSTQARIWQATGIIVLETPTGSTTFMAQGTPVMNVAASAIEMNTTLDVDSDIECYSLFATGALGSAAQPIPNAYINNLNSTEGMSITDPATLDFLTGGADQWRFSFNGTEFRAFDENSNVKLRQDANGQMIVGNNLATVPAFVSTFHVQQPTATAVSALFGHYSGSSIYMVGNSINSAYGAVIESDLEFNRYSYQGNQTVNRNTRFFDGKGVELMKVDAADARLEVAKIAPLVDQCVHSGVHVIGDLTFPANAGEVTAMYMPIDTVTPGLPMEMLFKIGSKAMLSLVATSDGAGDVTPTGVAVNTLLGVLSEYVPGGVNGVVMGTYSGEHGVLFPTADDAASVQTLYNGYLELNGFFIHKSLEVPTYFPTESGSPGSRLITDGNGALGWESVDTGVDVSNSDVLDRPLTAVAQTVVTVTVSPVDATNPTITFHIFVSNPTNQTKTVDVEMFVGAGAVASNSYEIPRQVSIDIVGSFVYSGTITNGTDVYYTAADVANDCTILGTVKASTIRVYDVSQTQRVQTAQDHQIEFLDIIPSGPTDVDRQIVLSIDGVVTHIRCYD